MKTNQTKPSCEQATSLAARKPNEHSAAQPQPKAGGIHCGIYEIRGKQASSRFSFRIFGVFRGSSLSRRFVAACELLPLLQCREPRLVLFPLRVLRSVAAIVLLLLVCASASAATRYVWQDSPSPAPPYTTWVTAARVIQDAVDAAAPGDTVLVTNGLYAIGGRPVGADLLSNRVAIEKPIRLQSINGPAVTIIEGARALAGDAHGNGDGAVRCVYLGLTNAVLSGFTLTNGHTRTAGDYERDTSGGGVLGGTYSPIGGVLTNCTLTGNSAYNYGGGAGWGTLNNCVLTGNSASSGGGAYGGTLTNCVLTGNSASYYGGGASVGILNNCTLTGNSAEHGGGVCWAMLNNCIVYYNSARLEGANYDDYSSLNYCCTTPLPAGQGNIDEEPQLASAWRLSVLSPCRGAGNTAYATGFDIDGEPWANPPSMGCDDYRPGALTGPLTLSIQAAYTNVAVGFPVELTAWIEGRPTLSVWDFDDGDFALDQPWTTHAWTAPGDYVVALWAFNETHPEGVNTTLTVHVLPQPVHYVARANGNPSPPYLSWATAATNIQDAVDAAVPGALVWVTNGVYATGGRAVTSTMTNRVAVDKPLTLRSVNGPTNTIIQGHQVPGTTNGDGAIRCVYLADGATLSGFTLTNGATRTTGDWEREQCGGGVWCESFAAVVSNCTLSGNSAISVYGGYGGGGAYGGTLNNCVFTGNSASYGGGANYGTLNNCTLSGNSAEYGGGGASWCTLNNCTLSGNSAYRSGGGAYYGTLNNCVFTGNSANYGGGANCGTLNNCTLTGNSAERGGGAFGGTLNNCTLTGNSAADSGGGVRGDYSDWFAPFITLNNCIVYFNTAPSGPNYYSSYAALNYCCTTPLPTYGVGNISLDPQLLDASHVGADSPCHGAGSATYATGTDIDAEAWANPPSIGCDEYYPGPATGALRVTVVAMFTNVPTGYTVDLAGLIEGHVSLSAWDFGDGSTLTNRPYTSHAWAATGDYAVVLHACNESNPGGVSATATVHVVAQPIYYVAAANATPAPPYTSWATAATNIQDAVDAADVASVPPGSVLVLVSNGVYATGGRAVAGTMTNRVAVDKPLILRSVSGPQVTVIQGYQVPGTTNGDGAIRCVYLANGASMSGFTLTKGATRGSWTAALEDDQMSGGGLWCESTTEVISNCVVVGNSAGREGGGVSGGTLSYCTIATNSSIYGGGACGYVRPCTLNDCTLRGNSGWVGGGAAESTLNNCALTGNSAIGDVYGYGGGAANCTLGNCTLIANYASYSGGGALSEGVGAPGGTLNNCILYFNTAADSANYNQDSGVLSYCCTTPMPTSGIGNITNAPLFVDYANGNLRLQSNSPCINAGNNAFVSSPTDLDGNPRIVSGAVDIGAYEFQSPGSVISYAWLQGYGLPTDGSADFADADHDGMNNWQEWICGTCPTNPLSALRLLSAAPVGINVTLTWQSVAGVNYFLERSTNLASPFTCLGTNITGQAGTTSYADTNATGAGPFFYRVGVTGP